MNKQECAKVMAKIQLVDNRQVDALTLEEWFSTIGDLRFTDAVAAVTMHRQESDEWIQPVHVIRNTKRVRSALEREVRVARSYGLVDASFPSFDPLPIEVKEALDERRATSQRELAYEGTNYHHLR